MKPGVQFALLLCRLRGYHLFVVDTGHLHPEAPDLEQPTYLLIVLMETGGHLREGLAFVDLVWRPMAKKQEPECGEEVVEW
jgi:hypothetical protein